MAFKFKGSLSAVDASLKGGVIFDNEKLSDSKIMPKGKFTINEIDESTTDLAGNTLVTNFGKQENVAGMFSFNTGDWKDTDSAPVKLMMRVVNDVNDSDWVTIFDSSKTTVTWSSIATAGQTKFTVPNLDFKKAIIYINGVLQYPGLSYQTFGGTVTFSDKLSLGDQIYIIVGEDTESTKNSEFISTATSGQTVITLETEKTNNFVYINGVLQYPTSYSITGSTITLSSELYLNDNILVLSNDTAMNTFSASSVQDQKDFTLTDTFDSGMVFVNGILQYDNSYSITGNTLSFITGLNLNDEVFVFLNDPKFIDSVNTTYTSTVDDVQNSDKINIPYFHFSELQVFINGILQNPDSGAYTLNGTEVTLSSPLQVLDDIHVIVYNSPVQSDNLVTRADLASYASADELQALKTALLNEGINLKWQPHLPTIEVAFGLPRRSLKIWESGSTSNTNNYWLYPVDGTVWAGVGTLGTVPSSPFYKLDSNKDVITWTYTAVSDNVNRIFVPYNFGSINIFINGVLQSIELGHYTYSGQYITLNGSLNTGDNLIAVLGKLVFNTNPYVIKEELTNYVLKTKLSSSTGADSIGTSSGNTVEYELQKINDSIIKEFNCIEDLLLYEGSENERVYVKGYYRDTDVGGGYFYFNNEMKNKNNNVTIFDGWIRIVIDKTLSTHDVGLIPNDNSNATARLQQLVNALDDDYTLIGYGKHLVNDHIVFDTKNNISIKNGGGFIISGKELRDSWIHYGWYGNELPDAVLYFKFCPYLTISGIEVIGAKSWYSGYTATQTFEMGDAGIRLYNCPNSIIEFCTVSHVFTWPIYSEYGNNNIVRFNNISDCTRQSGINITAYSSNVSIINNKIYDCALYGIEIENFPSVPLPIDTEYVYCINNLILRCGRGISIVGNIKKADVKDNIIHESYSGIFTRTSTYSDEININNNIIKNCQNSYEITSSRNVYVNGGEVSAYNDPQWLFTSQYDSVMKFGDSRNKFYVHGWTPLAQAFILGNVTSLSVWIDGVKYTAVSGVRDDSVTLGTNGSISYSCLITLDYALPDAVELYTSIGYILTTSSFDNITKGIYTRQYNTSYPNNESIHFSNIIIRGIYNAIHTLESYADNSTIRQRFMRMVIEDCTYWARGGGNGIYFEGNLPSKGCLSAFTQAVPNLIPSGTPIRVSDVKTKNTTDTLRNRSFTTYTNGTCTGFFLNIVDGGNAGPSNVIIRMDGAVWYTIPASMWNAAGVINITFNTNISAGGHYISVENANGNLSYTSYELTIAMM